MIRSSALAATLLLLAASTPLAPATGSVASQAARPKGAPVQVARTSPTPSAETLTRLVSVQLRLPSAAADAASECLAKVIYHEAANQELRGQLAVAQLVLNRVHHQAFPKSICGVVNQPGQFFETAEYSPPADHRWKTAQAVAAIARKQQVQPVVPGALFVHAAYASPDWSGHKRLGRVGDQVFYR